MSANSTIIGICLSQMENTNKDKHSFQKIYFAQRSLRPVAGDLKVAPKNSTLRRGEMRRIAEEEKGANLSEIHFFLREPRSFLSASALSFLTRAPRPLVHATETCFSRIHLCASVASDLVVVSPNPLNDFMEEN